MPKGEGLPNSVLIAALIAVAIIATSFSGFKPTAFATDVASCQLINAAGSYQLTGNLLTPTNGCINITSSNTELDCAGFWINNTGVIGAQSIAVNVSNVNNVTVRNCRISGWGRSVGGTRGAINVFDSTNVNLTYNSFYNDTLSNQGVYLYFNNVDNSGVYNSRFFNNTNDNLLISNGSNNMIRNNTFDATSRGGQTGGQCIEIGSLFSSRIYGINNTIDNNTCLYYTDSIRIDGDSNAIRNTTISNNTIKHSGSSAIFADDNQNTTVKDNFIYNVTSFGAGITLTGTNSGNHTISGNTIINTTRRAIDLEGGSSTGTRTRNFIFNNTIINATDGIRAQNANISIYNNTITNSTDTDGDGGYAIYLVGSNDRLNNVSNNTIESNNYGVYVDLADASNITGNTFRYNRNYAVIVASGSFPNNIYSSNITGNSFCYNNASIENQTTFKYSIDNNTFCADQVSPANNALYTSVTSFTVNVTNTLNTTRFQNTSCNLFVNGAQVATNTTVDNKRNITFTYTPTASGNWYVYCADTFAGPNTANSSVFLLSAAAAPPASGGGSSAGEDKPKPPTPPPKVKDFALSAVNSIIQIFLGKSASNSLFIENTGEEDLVFSTLTVTGVDTSWLSLPSSLPTVLAGSSAALDIGITVPSDAAPKLYTAHATASASGITKSTSFDVRVEAACDGCFLASLKNGTLTTSKNQPVYNTLTITNVGNVELTAQLSAMGDTRSWILFAQDSMKIPAGQEQSQTIEITPTISEDGLYPVNITISSGAKTQELSMLINLKTVPGCPVCPAPKESGACVNGKQQLTSYTCSEATGLTCQPTAQEVSCALVKKKKLLLPFFEAPLEHLENNLWIVLILAALAIYAGYRYYKKRQADKIKMQQTSAVQ